MRLAHAVRILINGVADWSLGLRTPGRALDVDPSLFNVWFNLANAQLKMNKVRDSCLRLRRGQWSGTDSRRCRLLPWQVDDAVASLKKTLELNSSVTAARSGVWTVSQEAD